MGTFWAACLLAALTMFQMVSSNFEETWFDNSTSSTNKTQISATADCSCVLFYQCINGTYDKHGINQITYKLQIPNDESIPRNQSPNSCPMFHSWCCSEPFKPADGQFPSKPVADVQLPSKPAEVTSILSQITFGRVQEASNSTKKTAECGHSQKSLIIQYKIIGRTNEVQPKEFPWSVMVLTKDGINPKSVNYHCGGSLIHERVVLTVAHCAAK